MRDNFITREILFARLTLGSLFPRNLSTFGNSSSNNFEQPPRFMQPLNTAQEAKLDPNSSLGKRRPQESSNKRQASAVIKTKDPWRKRKTTVAERGVKTT